MWRGVPIGSRKKLLLRSGRGWGRRGRGEEGGGRKREEEESGRREEVGEGLSSYSKDIHRREKEDVQKKWKSRRL